MIKLLGIQVAIQVACLFGVVISMFVEGTKSRKGISFSDFFLISTIAVSFLIMGSVVLWVLLFGAPSP